MPLEAGRDHGLTRDSVAAFGTSAGFFTEWAQGPFHALAKHAFGHVSFASPLCRGCGRSTLSTCSRTSTFRHGGAPRLPTDMSRDLAIQDEGRGGSGDWFGTGVTCVARHGCGVTASRSCASAANRRAAVRARAPFGASCAACWSAASLRWAETVDRETMVAVTPRRELGHRPLRCALAVAAGLGIVVASACDHSNTPDSNRAAVTLGGPLTVPSPSSAPTRTTAPSPPMARPPIDKGPGRPIDPRTPTTVPTSVAPIESAPPTAPRPSDGPLSERLRQCQERVEAAGLEVVYLPAMEMTQDVGTQVGVVVKRRGTGPAVPPGAGSRPSTVERLPAAGCEVAVELSGGEPAFDVSPGASGTTLSFMTSSSNGVGR